VPRARRISRRRLRLRRSGRAWAAARKDITKFLPALPFPDPSPGLSSAFGVLDAAEADGQGSGMGFQDHMEAALEEARAAAARGEVPVGAVVVGADGAVVARAGNRVLELKDPTAHAEILAIRTACAAAGSERLPGHAIYVTLEPCPMCSAAIAGARIARLVYGAADPKSGGVAQGPRIFSHPQCHHRPEVLDGIGAEAAAALLRSFFNERR
jgi:tRNA(adenine34) deaminase